MLNSGKLIRLAVRSIYLISIATENRAPEFWRTHRSLEQSRPQWIGTLRSHRTLFFALIELVIVGIGATAVWWTRVGGCAYRPMTPSSTPVQFRSAAQVKAAIVEVPVSDNELVAKGTVLARLDDRDYKAQVDEVKAQIDQDKAQCRLCRCRSSARSRPRIHHDAESRPPNHKRR